MFDTVRGGDQLAGIIAGLDPDATCAQSAQSWWHTLDRIERLAGSGKTLLARRLAATHSARDGGTSLGAAKDALDTSTRLPTRWRPRCAAASSPRPRPR